MQFDWIIGIFYSMLTFLTIFGIIMIIVNILILGWALRYVGGTNTDFMDAAISAILISILTAFIPCLGCIISLYLLTLRHEIGWGSAIIAWIIATLISIVVTILVFILFFGGIAGLLSLIPAFPFP
ncbi:MAG: hypothetical protein ACFFEU_14815 [Candidatus Thorarchaeota archaeon]|jgi:hypothetical protein